MQKGSIVLFFLIFMNCHWLWAGRSQPSAVSSRFGTVSYFYSKSHGRPRQNSKLATRYSELTTRYSKLTTRYSKLTTRYSFTHIAMGSAFNLVFYAPNDSIAKMASDSVFKRIDFLNTILSDYLDGSETNRLSATAGTGEKFYASPLLFDILQKSICLSQQTKGAFDVTIGPVVQLWRRAMRRNYFPPRKEIRAAKQVVGYHFIKLNEVEQSVLLKKKGMRLDFGGVGKGYAADQSLLVLRHFGITAALIDAGGDLTLGDAPPNKKGWEIEVSSGGKDTTAKHLLTLNNCGVATSGATYRYLEHKGIRYSHIVNPHTGVGLTTHTRTTVIAPNGTAADALATGFSVLGIKRGATIAKKINGIEVWLLEQNGTQIYHYAVPKIKK
ncbi:MAG: FAD:protein FMN transferase [Spirosomataceae bacterium]